MLLSLTFKITPPGGALGTGFSHTCNSFPGPFSTSCLLTKAMAETEIGAATNLALCCPALSDKTVKSLERRTHLCLKYTVTPLTRFVTVEHLAPG